MVKKHVLLYDWGGQPQPDLQAELSIMPDCELYVLSHEAADYESDAVFEGMLRQSIIDNQIVVCVSFDYFPVISKVCQEMDVLYASWIYDCPHFTLYSKTIGNSCNLVFTFDYLQMEEFRRNGIHQIFHLPLAVNVERLERFFGCVDMPEMRKKLSADVSFVGSMYAGNHYEKITYLPPRLKGYLEGICAAQLQIYGYSILEDLMSCQLIEELKKYVKLSLDPEYTLSYEKIFCELFLKKYISSRERKNMLTSLSRQFHTVLYSGSNWSCDGLESRGMVSYTELMPLVFHCSRLNLNLSIRSIQSGIPLRCMDIMGAGGALISNYQPELAEYFIPDKEWICFQGKEELMDKAAFYLSHEELREEIARSAFEKVKAQFTYKQALKTMFGIVDSYL